MQNLSDILPLFCTPTWPSHHVGENQEFSNWFTRSIVKRYGFIIIALDRTHTIYFVFQSSGFYNIPRVLIAEVISRFRRHLEVTDTLGLDLMLVSIRCQTRRNLDHLKLLYIVNFKSTRLWMTMSLSRWSAKTTRKSQL